LSLPLQINLNDMKNVTTPHFDVPDSVFANLLTDYMFKRVYGNKDVLLTFLNMILTDIDVADLEYQSTEALGNSPNERKAIYDIKCRSKEGEIFIVEMQLARQKHFIDRSLYYLSMAINQQANIANSEAKLNDREWNYAINPVIFIAFTNFELPHQDNFPENEYISEYMLRETKTGELMTRLQKYIFIELPRFSSPADQCISELEKWVYSMRHMHKLKNRPSNFNEESLARLYDLSKFANFETDEYQLYKDSLMYVSDYKNTIEYAKEEGIEIGRAEGRAEARAEVISTLIKNMLDSGMTCEKIAELIQIPIDEVKQYASFSEPA